MAHMHLGKQSFADFAVNTKEELHAQLVEINARVDWNIFAKKLRRIHSKITGRKSYPPILMFKCLLLQNWYGLSDYELEKNLDDRLSFRRFVGISYSEAVPDHSSFCNFRRILEEGRIYEKIFAMFNEFLEKEGMIINQGTMIDASVIDADSKKPNRQANGESGKSESDPDARWGRKGRKSFFGYKMHLGVDTGSMFIRSYELTPANTSDCNVFNPLIKGSEESVFADKAYDSKVNRDYLHQQDIRDGILIKKHRRKLHLTEAEKNFNSWASKLRAPVEGVFGILKRHYRYRRVRYRSLERNRLELCLKVLCYNMRKLVSIMDFCNA